MYSDKLKEESKRKISSSAAKDLRENLNKDGAEVFAQLESMIESQLRIIG